ncbi:MAG: phosphatidylglycerophosphatase A [Planctomycetales bacterium]
MGGRFARLLATGFGAGYAPVAAGTVGSLWGLPLVWCVQRIPGGPAVQGAIAFGAFVAGVWICTRAARDFRAKDPRQIVYDEYTAFLVVFLFVPLTWTSAVAGFVWFRVFDILKPWPIDRVERLPAGLGIMADDFVAALYAAAALLLTVRVLAMFGVGVS